MLMIIGSSCLSACHPKAQALYDVEAGIKAGDVIVSPEDIKNLHVFNAFYDAVAVEETSHVVLMMKQGNTYEKEVLAFNDKQIRRYAKIEETKTGYHEYEMMIYDDIKQIFKDDTVTYLLINDDREDEILSYTLEN